MNVGLRWLCRQCWGWRFYIVGLLGWSVLELALFLSLSRWQFIETSRDVGTIGIALTLVYMAIVVTVMILTLPKTTLDRRWIWHMISVGLLFAFALGLNVRPEWYGQPPPGLPPEGEQPSDRLIIAAAVWFQFWGFVMWSALAVLISTWDERGRFIWHGFTRRLRPIQGDAAEVP